VNVSPVLAWPLSRTPLPPPEEAVVLCCVGVFVVAPNTRSRVTDSERKSASKGQSLPGEDQRRGKSGHRKKATERGSLTC